MAQINVSYSDNWWYQAKADLETLNIDLTLGDQGSDKGNVHKRVKDSVNRLAFLYLNSEKLKLSKISHIEHRAFEIQPYFTNGKLTIQQMKFLFAARSRGLDLRCNFKGKYPDTNCPLCSPLSVGV